MASPDFRPGILVAFEIFKLIIAFGQILFGFPFLAVWLEGETTFFLGLFAVRVAVASIRCWISVKVSFKKFCPRRNG